MLPIKEFYLFPEDVYRMGNSTTHRMGVVRADEITTTAIEGVTVVVANNLGVSVWTKEGIVEKGLTGYAWLIRAGVNLPFGLKLVSDQPGHYMLVPVQNIPLDAYKGLLEQMGMNCVKYLQVKKDGTMLRVG